MSACDTCPKPGHCCRAISLGGGMPFDAETSEQAQEWLDGINYANSQGPTDTPDAMHLPLPFRPLFKRATEGGWMWWCPNLNRATGRCDDYDNRPHTCRMYKPKEDALCVLHEPETAQ